MIEEYTSKSLTHWGYRRAITLMKALKQTTHCSIEVICLSSLCLIWRVSAKVGSGTPNLYGRRLALAWPVSGMTHGSQRFRLVDVCRQVLPLESSWEAPPMSAPGPVGILVSIGLASTGLGSRCPYLLSGSALGG